jgi:hypothetical protein
MFAFDFQAGPLLRVSGKNLTGEQLVKYLAFIAIFSLAFIAAYRALVQG